jgi:tellurite resistance protein
MTTTVIPVTYTNTQIIAWVRGLLTLAWADGDFDLEEQKLITSFTHDELGTDEDLTTLEPISTSELVSILGDNHLAVENFLRTAVMVALADGIYTLSEHHVLEELFIAFGKETKALEALQHTLVSNEHDHTAILGHVHIDPLSPVKHWLDDLQIHDQRIARFLCKMIPPQCPFERDVKLFNHKIVHIPPLCKLNPLYDQLIGLRFRALSYLADDCHQDISAYI